MTKTELRATPDDELSRLAYATQRTADAAQRHAAAMQREADAMRKELRRRRRERSAPKPTQHRRASHARA